MKMFHKNPTTIILPFHQCLELGTILEKFNKEILIEVRIRWLLVPKCPIHAIFGTMRIFPKAPSFFVFLLNSNFT